MLPEIVAHRPNSGFDPSQVLRNTLDCVQENRLQDMSDLIAYYGKQRILLVHNHEVAYNRVSSIIGKYYSADDNFSAIEDEQSTLRRLEGGKQCYLDIKNMIVTVATLGMNITNLSPNPVLAGCKQHFPKTVMQWLVENMVNAASRGDIIALQRFYDNGADANRMHDGMTPLCIAAKNDQSHIVRELVVLPHYCISIDFPYFTFSALIHAAQSGNAETVELLLDRGADVNNSHNPDSKTALIIAAEHDHPAVVALLLQTKKGVIEIDAQDKKKYTAFLYAVENNSVSVAQLLIEHKCNIEVGDGAALAIALSRGHVEMAHFLLHQQIIVKQEWFGDGELLIEAIIKKDLNLVRTQLQKNPKSKVLSPEAFTVALLLRQTNIIRALLTQGEDVSKQDNIGKTGLMYAAQSADTASIKSLLSKRVLITTQGFEGKKASIHPAQTSRLSIFQKALYCGADRIFDDEANAELALQLKAYAYVLYTAPITVGAVRAYQSRNASTLSVKDAASVNQLLETLEELHEKLYVSHKQLCILDQDMRTRIAQDQHARERRTLTVGNLRIYKKISEASDVLAGRQHKPKIGRAVFAIIDCLREADDTQHLDEEQRQCIDEQELDCIIMAQILHEWSQYSIIQPEFVNLWHLFHAYFYECMGSLPECIEHSLAVYAPDPCLVPKQLEILGYNILCIQGMLATPGEQAVKWRVTLGAVLDAWINAHVVQDGTAFPNEKSLCTLLRAMRNKAVEVERTECRLSQEQVTACEVQIKKLHNQLDSMAEKNEDATSVACTLVVNTLIDVIPVQHRSQKDADPGLAEALEYLNCSYYPQSPTCAETPSILAAGSVFPAKTPGSEIEWREKKTINSGR